MHRVIIFEQVHKIEISALYTKRFQEIEIYDKFVTQGRTVLNFEALFNDFERIGSCETMEVL